jgi:hypothetical protein
MTAHPVEAEARSESPPQRGVITINLVIPGAATGWCAASCAVIM